MRERKWIGFILSGFAVATLAMSGTSVAMSQAPPAEEESPRCGGPTPPKCATIKSCKGILWWKKCATRSIYFPAAN